MWQSISVNKVIKDGIDIDRNFLYDHFDLNPSSPFSRFLKTYAKTKGCDVTPLKSMLIEVIEPLKVNNSPRKLGIVLCSYPSFSELDVLVNDLREDQVVDYLMASASCYPVFPVYSIGKKKYVDGGWKNNLPIDYALRLGADEVIAVMLNSIPAAQKREYFSLPNVKVIYPSCSQGSMLNFSQSLIEPNIEMGYLDGKKAFGELFGNAYFFLPSPKLKELAHLHFLEMMKDGALSFHRHAKILLKEARRPTEGNEINLFLLNLERLLKLYEVPALHQFGIEEAIHLLSSRIVNDTENSSLQKANLKNK